MNGNIATPTLAILCANNVSIFYQKQRRYENNGHKSLEHRINFKCRSLKMAARAGAKCQRLVMFVARHYVFAGSDEAIRRF